MKQEVRFDCRHFRGDRPCDPHKRFGVLCTCEHFSPWQERILILKLGAPGDVLRSTCILPELRKARPESFISWISDRKSLPLLEGNPHLDEILPWDEDVPLRLAVEEFDLLLSLEVDRRAGQAAAMAGAGVKLGFGCDAAGKVIPLSPEAEEWFLMGCFDPFKKANRKSYPQILHEICRLPWSHNRPVLCLSEEEKGFAARFAERCGLGGDGKVVGLFTGAGRRWPNKAWTEEGFAGLAELLLAEGMRVLLLGGPEEAQRNRRLKKAFPHLLDAGCDNGLREFAALVGLCDVLVTGDTLALHVATAQGVPAVALVGPTSPAEIDVYGTLVVTADVECLCCYRTVCEKSPSCMQRIEPRQVFEAVGRLL